MNDEEFPDASGGSSTETYHVGHGRPPKATQFKKGASGNPRGRPKKVRSVGAILREALSRKISVQENGATRKVLALDVIIRRLVNDAARGVPHSMKHLFLLLDRYGESAQTDIDAAALSADDRAILDSYFVDRASAEKMTRQTRPLNEEPEAKWQGRERPVRLSDDQEEAK